MILIAWAAAAPWAVPLITAGVSAIGGYLTQRRQIQQDNTAVQRRADDLRNAGINPILAAGQAAQSSSLQNPVEGIGKSGQAASALALQRRLQGVQIENIEAKTEETKAKTGVISEEEVIRKARAQFWRLTGNLVEAAERLLRDPRWSSKVVDILFRSGTGDDVNRRMEGVIKEAQRNKGPLGLRNPGSSVPEVTERHKRKRRERIRR